MQVEIHDSIGAIDADAWNALAGDEFPYIRHEFLLAGEENGCVSAAAGWQPLHLTLFDGDELVGAMPLYAKNHSWGEFVFDWGWAQAYERAGLEYYPKLISAAPFTPAPGTRLLARDNNPDIKATLLAAAVRVAEEGEYSSLHVLFPDADDRAVLESCGLKLRKDCQFHWHNDGYRSFDEFLGAFSSSKRKKARRDRRHVAEAGVTFRHLHGADIDEETWTVVYELMSITFLRRGSLPYYNQEFFQELSRTMPESLLVILGERDGVPIAAAVFYRAPDALYGRYWGSTESINALHFETCYYQGIDYCIEHGISRFEPGTQGEHKISRGFTPVSTYSAHWLQKPEFFSAIERFLEQEERYIDRYMDAVEEHSPFRQADRQ